MPKINLDHQTKDALGRLLVRHLKDEYGAEIEPVDALSLLDFLSETLGPHYYNQGLRDAQAVVRARADAIVETIYDLEQPLKR